MPEPVKAAPVKRRSPKGDRTRALILDVAEELFSEISYEGVTHRQIAERANVLLGVLTHHFPTKQSIFEEVVGRRAAELNDARIARLRSVKRLTLEKVIAAFYEPHYELIATGGRPWAAYSRLMALIVQSPFGAELQERYFHDVAVLFLNALQEVLPGVDRMSIARALIYSIDIMVNGMTDQWRLPSLTESPDLQDTPSAAREVFIPFVIGGFRELERKARREKRNSAQQ